MKRKFYSTDVLPPLLSLITLIFDISSDIALVIVFFTNGQQIFASLTLSLFAVSTFVTQLCSFHWHATDKDLTWRVLIMHVLFLAPFHRYWNTVRVSLRAKQTQKLDDIAVACRANNDVCLLRLIQVFLESAPQSILQMYIILSSDYPALGHYRYLWLLGISVAASLISIAWSITAYMDGLRLAFKDDHERKWISIVTHVLWQILMILARIIALAVFASYFQFWIFLALGIRWLMMICCVTLQNADFGDSTCEKRLLNTIAGYIQIFCFLNLKDGPSRCKLSVYHFLTFAENTVLVMLWFYYKPDDTSQWYNVFTFSTVYGGFVLGGVVSVLYYIGCHPSGPKTKAVEEEEEMTGWFRRIQSLQPKKKKSLFEVKDHSFQVVDWLNASLPLSNEAASRDVSRRPSADYGYNKSLLSELPLQFLSSKSPMQKTTVSFHRTSSTDMILDKMDGNSTFGSGRGSYFSAASSTQNLLMSSKSTSELKERVNKVSYSEFGIEDISKIYPSDSLSYYRSPEKRDVQNGHSLYRGKHLVSPEYGEESVTETAETSERIFAVTYSSLSHSSHITDSIKNDSLYDSSDLKSIQNLSLSPLDPIKLWESTMQGSYHISPLLDISELPFSSKTPILAKEVKKPDLSTSSGHDTSSFHHSGSMESNASNVLRSTDDSGYSNTKSNLNTFSSRRQLLSEESSLSDTVSSMYTTHEGSSLDKENSKKEYSLSVPLLDQIKKFSKETDQSITFSTDTEDKTTSNVWSVSDISKPASSRSTLPGLSYLNDSEISFADQSQSITTLTSSNSLKDYSRHSVDKDQERDTVPYTCPKQETSSAEPYFPLLSLDKLTKLSESPYKSRSNSSKKSVNIIKNAQLNLSVVDVRDLTESPYKFRYQSQNENVSKDIKKQVVRASLYDESKKENLTLQEMMTKKDKHLKRRLSSNTLERKISMTLSKSDNGSQVGSRQISKCGRSDFEACDSGYKSRLHHMAGNSTPKEPGNNSTSEISSSSNQSSCYISTDDSDVIIDHSKATTPKNYTKRQQIRGLSTGRPALKSLENTPPFSPIMHNSKKDNGNLDSCDNKHTVSTPVLKFQQNMYLYEDFEPLSLLEEPSTLRV